MISEYQGLLLSTRDYHSVSGIIHSGQDYKIYVLFIMAVARGVRMVHLILLEN